ncbi:MAG: hypothetical protein AAF481_13015 [Acidobacteriota bacterium]
MSRHAQDVLLEESFASLYMALGANPGEAAELRNYGDNRFDPAAASGLSFPLPDEAFVACWQKWENAARRRGAWEVLRAELPQLAFPVREGISKSSAYRAATLKGVDPTSLDEATGLQLDDPSRLELELFESPAGRVPVLRIQDSGRQEFVALVRALSRRNEPATIPEAMGAQMLAGYNNWARLHRLRRAWEATDPAERETATWGEELRRILPQKERYQDRFMILSDGPYSAVSAEELGLEEAEWRRKSFVIRRDHEAAHYFTRRVFGSMRNHLLDELIADYAGIVAAEGRFRADWFLRFVGLDPRGHLLPEGRIAIYRGDPPLSDGAFAALGRMMVRVADHVQTFDRRAFDSAAGRGERTQTERAATFLALAGLRLEELAADKGATHLTGAYEAARTTLRDSADP